jgi:hypothetical protein
MPQDEQEEFRNNIEELLRDKEITLDTNNATMLGEKNNIMRGRSQL